MQLPDLKIPEKEKKILEAAIAIIYQKGFSATTTSEIARTAGVSEGTIYRYFRTKKDILHGILIQFLNLLAEPVILDGVKKILADTNQKDLRSIIKALMQDRIILIESLFPMIQILITEAMYHEDIREAAYRNIISRVVEISTVFHQQMSDRGLMRKDLDPLVMLRTILGNVILLFVYRKFFANQSQLNDLDQELEKVLDVIMFGIAGRPDQRPQKPSSAKPKAKKQLQKNT
ncbi:MAG: TetR/AcrR family transcriptional regulator [Thermodesulfobacteriota bacterium]|jgi:AcrR family transcriptional regulator